VYEKSDCSIGNRSSTFAFVAVKPQANAAAVKNIVIYVGKTSGTIDGKSTTLDQAPVIVNGRTLVPIRFIS